MATRIQTASAVAASGAATITWPSATTLGNLLVAICVLDDGSGANVTPPLGWIGNTAAGGGGSPLTRFFYRWGTPVVSSSVFTPSTGGIRVVAAEYSGVANLLNPMNVKDGKAVTSPTTSFSADAFSLPLYSSNDLFVVGVGCETAAIPFSGFSPAGFSTAVSASSGGLGVAIVDRGTAGALTGVNPSWTASAASEYSIVKYAFYPVDATPIFATGNVQASGAALVVVTPHIHTASGGFRVSGQATPTIWNAIGGVTLSGVAFVRATYVYQGDGSISVGGLNDNRGGGNYASSGDIGLSGLVSTEVGVATTAVGGFRITGLFPVVLQYSYVTTGNGRLARLRGEATCAITSRHEAYSGRGTFTFGGEAACAITSLNLAYEAAGEFEVRGLASAAITNLNLAYVGGGEFVLTGDATEAITSLNLAYVGGGRFRLQGDATEEIGYINLAYQGGGAISIDGDATEYPTCVGQGGFVIRGVASVDINTANFVYEVNAGRVIRLGGRGPHEFAALYDHDASGSLTLGGLGHVYGTGHLQEAIGDAVLSGTATCRPGATVRGTGEVSFSGLGESSWLVTHFQRATGPVSISGEALVYPPLHQTGTGGGRLTGQGVFGKGYVFTFGSPEWWQKSGRLTLTGAAQIVRAFEAVGGGQLAIGGTAGTQGPVGGVGQIGTLSGEAITRYGPSFVGDGVLCSLTGEQEPPVLGQKVFMTGRFAVSGLAELHTAHYAYAGSGRVQLVGAARAVALVTIGNQDTEGGVALTGDAEHRIGYAASADGGVTLSGEALAAWGYTAVGGGELVITGHSPLENSFVYEAGGVFGLTGRAFLRMVFHFLYDASGDAVLTGAAPFGPAYEYGATGVQRLSGVASAASYWGYRHDMAGSVVLGGRAHVVSTAVYSAAMSGSVSFGGSNDRQTRDITAATGSLGLRGECSTSGPNAPDIVDQGGQQASQSCVMTQAGFLNLLRQDSQLYMDLVALGSSKWTVQSFDCDTRTARLVVAGRTLDITMPPPVETSGDRGSSASPRVRREVDPGIFRAAARPARPGGYVPISGRVAAPVMSKASLLARLPASSPLRRELERLGVGGWELVDRGSGRVAIRMQGRYLDFAVPA